jgi:hypothetical protein
MRYGKIPFLAAARYGVEDATRPLGRNHDQSAPGLGEAGARERTCFDGGCLNGKQYLLMDRDTRFCNSFPLFLTDDGMRSVHLPPRAPRMTADRERFSRLLKFEYLNQVILLGEQTMRNAVRQHMGHSHAEHRH